VLEHMYILGFHTPLSVNIGVQFFNYIYYPLLLYINMFENSSAEMEFHKSIPDLFRPFTTRNFP
jgi:hypothetical protein